MCTDTDHGFSSSNEYSNTITWKSIRNGVKKVELVFKQTGDQLGHAQIAEMEIIYNNERNDKGKNYHFTFLNDFTQTNSLNFTFSTCRGVFRRSVTTRNEWLSKVLARKVRV